MPRGVLLIVWVLLELGVMGWWGTWLWEVGNSCAIQGGLRASRRDATRTFINHLGREELPRFVVRFGRLPDSLEELAATADEGERILIRDAWGRALHYEVGPEGQVRLGSLGAFGMTGGTGDAADIHWPDDFWNLPGNLKARSGR